MREESLVHKIVSICGGQKPTCVRRRRILHLTLLVYPECRPAFFLENAMGKQFGMDWMELNTELLLPCCSSKENGGAAFTLNVEGQMEIRHPEKE